MSIEIVNDLNLPEVKLIKNIYFDDERGYFKKIFIESLKKELNFEVDEVYYSINNKSVIRGIHYQKQPSPISKIVTCVEGKVLDFVIDLREDSPNYKKYTTLTLQRDENISIFIPNGFGHGFSVLENNTIINYLQSGNYDPESESGINPLSIKIDWLVDDPILSDRDISLPGINT